MISIQIPKQTTSLTQVRKISIPIPRQTTSLTQVRMISIQIPRQMTSLAQVFQQLKRIHKDADLAETIP
jgi:hypothetical protein